MAIEDEQIRLSITLAQNDAKKAADDLARVRAVQADLSTQFSRGYITANQYAASKKALAAEARNLERDLKSQARAVERLEIEVAFRAWPRPWQQDAAAWLDARGEGGFTREVVSHFLFLTRRLLGPLALVEAAVSYPPGDAAETSIRARLTSSDR